MARETRTMVQVEANKLDLQMFNMAHALFKFADGAWTKKEKEALADLALSIRQHRYIVQRRMHSKDLDAIKSVAAE